MTSVGGPFPIRLARVYEAPDTAQRARLLVDRLWPRGVAKAALQLDFWAKEAAPSTGLRQWFHAAPRAAPRRFAEFADRYRAELRDRPDAVEQCLVWCRRGPVLLLTAARDPGQSHAAVLGDHLSRLLGEKA